MRMSIYSISLKSFVLLVFFIGMLLGMTLFYHYPEFSTIVVAGVGGVLRGIVSFLFGFES